MLHVAPEPVLAKKFQQRFGEYVSIDLDGDRAMKAMDVTALIVMYDQPPKVSIISQTYNRATLLGRVSTASSTCGAPNPGLHGMADRAFETLKAASVKHEPAYVRADLCFKQLTIYTFNAPDVFAT